ncbi:hypothetical protein B0H17DRAFT_456734 [Mycena rosella]|uniref:Uncharacterized protein n=1 Tax=Mycena rosella TaxID=1033263 RepID=A0AAD7GKA5_MYCRO|nr:hypothetical protein B0H17DRAFT_456734 [Mycena rosella]
MDHNRIYPEKCNLDLAQVPSMPKKKCQLTGVKIKSLLIVVGLYLIYWGRAHLPQHSPSARPIDWKPCHEDSSFLCGYLNVPTDYDNPSAGTSRLALSNYPATCPESERLGIILTNVSASQITRYELTAKI